MKKVMLILIIVMTFSFFGCSEQQTSGNGYTKITPEEGKIMLDDDQDIILIDVRTKEEYDQGHIEGSILIPYDIIAKEIAAIAPDKSTKIIVYCRSGNRSKTAADTLIELGYKKVYDMGGIISWPYETTN